MSTLTKFTIESFIFTLKSSFKLPSIFRSKGKVKPEPIDEDIELFEPHPQETGILVRKSDLRRFRKAGSYHRTYNNAERNQDQQLSTSRNHSYSEVYSRYVAEHGSNYSIYAEREIFERLMIAGGSGGSGGSTGTSTADSDMKRKRGVREKLAVKTPFSTVEEETASEISEDNRRAEVEADRIRDQYLVEEKNFGDSVPEWLDSLEEAEKSDVIMGVKVSMEDLVWDPVVEAYLLVPPKGVISPLVEVRMSNDLD